MFQRILVVPLAVSLLFQSVPAAAQDMRPSQPAPAQPSIKDNLTSKEVLTDAAVVALIIAGSIAIYKATGRPCACPSDTMKNGRSCGGNSAYSRPGGARPLCFATDITASMIDAYRRSKSIPAVW